ncbi:LysR family transcriptional regulator [Phytohalomonas tamaricis]|uniref:LysR family transcriptional regulator n=1 Tax=Phytohalomonas tamaricis TaxID=2081032 RepID=UPI000D0BAE0C|nr:LysR family transcriptional regulator [Phytohalomonas tamaricis]
MQRWDRIEAFVEVVRLGSFSAAARQLRVSSSHVSRLIGQLESQLGTQLLYRTTRQLRLTDAGRVYFEHCHQLFEGFKSAHQAIQELQDQPKGVLKLTSATTFGERYIAPLVNDFQRRHPQLEIDMHFTNRRVDLIDEGYDVAIRLGVLEDSTLIARRLGARHEYVVGSPDYLARHGQPNTLADLTHHNCLVGSKPSWLFEVKGQRREVRISGNWRANSGPALLDATLKGLGLAQLPDYYVADYLKSGELVALLEAYQYPQMGIWVVYPRHRHLSPKVRNFVDFLAERMAIDHARKKNAQEE